MTRGLIAIAYTAYAGRRSDVEGALGLADLTKGLPVILRRKGGQLNRRAKVASKPKKTGRGWQIYLRLAVAGEGADTRYSQHATPFSINNIGLVPVNSESEGIETWVDDYVVVDESVPVQD